MKWDRLVTGNQRAYLEDEDGAIVAECYIREGEGYELTVSLQMGRAFTSDNEDEAKGAVKTLLRIMIQDLASTWEMLR